MDVVLLVLVLVYLAAVMYIGYWAMKRSKTLADFLVAGYNLPPIIVAFTMLAAWFSGWAFVVAPGYGYAYGFPIIWWEVALGLSPMISLAFFALPLRTSSERLGSMSLPDWVGDRYASKLARAITAIIVIGVSVVSMMAQYKAVATSLLVLFSNDFH